MTSKQAYELYEFVGWALPTDYPTHRSTGANSFSPSPIPTRSWHIRNFLRFGELVGSAHPTAADGTQMHGQNARGTQMHGQNARGSQTHGQNARGSLGLPRGAGRDKLESLGVAHSTCLYRA